MSSIINEIVGYILNEWNYRELVEDVRIDNKENEVIVVFSSNVRDRVKLYDTLLSDVFKKFKDNDNIWDVFISYRCSYVK